jgi:hypothetical protein
MRVWKHQKHQTHIIRNTKEECTFENLRVYLYVYVYLYVCVCVCVCVCKILFVYKYVCVCVCVQGNDVYVWTFVK